MSRQQYETEADLAREREVLGEFARCCFFDMAHKLSPLKHQVDFMIMRSDVAAAWVECKDRTEHDTRRGLPFGYGDGYYLSLTKISAALQLSAASNLPAILVVRFKDGSVYWTKLAPVARTIWFGRDDRGDPADHEPCGVIPWSAFHRVT